MHVISNRPGRCAAAAGHSQHGHRGGLPLVAVNHVRLAPRHLEILQAGPATIQSMPGIVLVDIMTNESQHDK